MAPPTAMAPRDVTHVRPTATDTPQPAPRGQPAPMPVMCKRSKTPPGRVFTHPQPIVTINKKNDNYAGIATVAALPRNDKRT